MVVMVRGFLGDFALDNSRPIEVLVVARLPAIHVNIIEAILLWSIHLAFGFDWVALLAACLLSTAPLLGISLLVHLDDIEAIIAVVAVVNAVRVRIDALGVVRGPSEAGAHGVGALLQAHIPVLLDFDGGQL